MPALLCQLLLVVPERPAQTDLSRPPRQLAARTVPEAYRWQLARITTVDRRVGLQALGTTLSNAAHSIKGAKLHVSITHLYGRPNDQIMGPVGPLKYPWPTAPSQVRPHKAFQRPRPGAESNGKDY